MKPTEVITSVGQVPLSRLAAYGLKPGGHVVVSWHAARLGGSKIADRVTPSR